MSEHLTPPVLLLGVGNELRGDDAAGRRVADVVAGWDRPGVTVVQAQQLVPELATVVSRAATVVLIDAAVGGSDTPSLVPISANAASGPLSHSTSLPELLALARCLEGRAPQAWVLAVPADSFEYGAAFSPRCRRGIDDAIRLLAALSAG